VDALSGAFRALLENSGGMIEYLAMEKRAIDAQAKPVTETAGVILGTNPWHRLEERT
jgi:hypothetical protein